MALTRNFKQTVVERVARDPQFAKALLDEAATLFLIGEPETARLILPDLINPPIYAPHPEAPRSFIFRRHRRRARGDAGPARWREVRSGRGVSSGRLQRR